MIRTLLMVLFHGLVVHGDPICLICPKELPEIAHPDNLIYASTGLQRCSFIDSQGQQGKIDPSECQLLQTMLQASPSTCCGSESGPAGPETIRIETDPSGFCIASLRGKTCANCFSMPTLCWNPGETLNVHLQGKNGGYSVDCSNVDHNLGAVSFCNGIVCKAPPPSPREKSTSTSNLHPSAASHSTSSTAPLNQTTGNPTSSEGSSSRNNSSSPWTPYTGPYNPDSDGITFQDFLRFSFVGLSLGLSYGYIVLRRCCGMPPLYYINNDTDVNDGEDEAQGLVMVECYATGEEHDHHENEACLPTATAVAV